MASPLDSLIDQVDAQAANDLPKDPTAADNNVLIAPVGSASNTVVYPARSATPVAAPTSTSSATNPTAKEPTLPAIPKTKFATPSPRVASTKEEIEKVKAEIKELEKQTTLNTLPYILGGELARIKHQFTDINVNKYYLLLLLLVHGFDNNIMSASIGHPDSKYIIDDNFIKDFQKMIKIPQLTDILKKTPAYSKGCFESFGQFGNMAANGDRMDSNPITGPTKRAPSLVTNTMERIAPGSVSALEKFCNTIRTRAYLSMPRTAFGSIAKIARIVNGALVAFNRAVRGFYKELGKYIRKVYAMVNGIINEIQRQLMQFIEGIIPLDLICLILDTVQCIMDDIGFFTSLFNVTGPILNYLNAIQTVINTASNLVQNPFETLKGFLPPEVTQVLDTIDEIGKDPEGFISDQLSNMGLSYVDTALQGDIVGAVMEKFGSNYSSTLSPFGDAMSKAAAIWNRYSADGSRLPTSLSQVGETFFNNGTEDLFGEKVDKTDVIQNLKSDFLTLNQEISGLPAAISGDLNALGSGVKDLISIANPFKSKTAFPNTPENATDTTTLSDGTPIARAL